MKGARGLVTSLVFVGVLVLISLIGLSTGTRPVLGLDLRGGVQVVLHAPPGTTTDVMNQALENIRNRVDALGVGEPDLSVSSSDILVQIPGLARGSIEERRKTQYCFIGREDENLGCYPTEEEAARVLASVAVTTDVQEVCLSGPGEEAYGCFASKADADSARKAVTVQAQGDEFCLTGTQAATQPCFKTKQKAEAALSAIKETVKSQFCLQDGKNLGCFPTKAEADAALAGVNVTREPVEYCVVSSAGENLGCYVRQADAQNRLQATGQQHLLDIIGTTARLEQREVLGAIEQTDPEFAKTSVTCGAVADRLTQQCSFDALEKKDVVFLSRDGMIKYQLGPVEITGDAISKATATFQTSSQTNISTGWEVNFTLTSDGAKKFGEVTTRLNGRELAIVLDQKVISAPTIQNPITGGSGVITLGRGATEKRAKDLATVLNAGALPVQLTKSNVQTVSATLGKESLQQGLVAGIAGLAALAIYLAFYYRLLGVVTWLGMAIWAILALGFVSLLGRTAGYSLTLAGVAGLIISLGITADSYIVFYERLKDEVRHGKTPRAAIQPAFRRAWRTIIAADIVTILAAAVLYFLAIASVRGFAFTLGMATFLDMFVVYFFKRPTVFLIARSPKLTNLRGMGLTSGVAVAPEPVPVAGGSE